MDIKKYKFRTELHAHTSPASPCGDFTPDEVVAKYAALAYDSIVITNHFYPKMRFCDDKEKCIAEYLKDYNEAVKAGEERGINIILGCEIRFTENFNDYLLFGITPDTLDMAFDYIDEGLESFSKVFRGNDTVLVQAHPFRDRCVPAAPELLDGVEVFNLHPGQNSRVGVTAKFAKEHNLIATSGTDFHHEGHEGMTALLTAEEMKTSADIARVLKSGDYLIEIGGTVVKCK